MTDQKKSIKHQLQIGMVDSIVLAVFQLGLVIIALINHNYLFVGLCGFGSVVNVANATIRYNLQKSINE